MHVRHPVGVQTLAGDGRAFALLFAIESFARGLLATVIAVQALTLLDAPRDVSALYAMVGCVGLLASLAVPALVRATGRRWVYTGGAVALMLAAGALASQTVAGQALGMALRVTGAACLGICTSLYILQHISRYDLTRTEPRRLQASALAWTLGPALGVFIYRSAGAWVYALSAAVALCLLAVFWYLRLAEDTPVRPASEPPPRALRSLGRFWRAPRLRRAWLIAFARSSWWVFLFVYTPIYMLQAGAGEMAAALVVSGANALLLLSPLCGRLATRLGIRAIIRNALLLCAAATAACALATPYPSLVAVLLLVGAAACVALDALGNIPFLRMVRRRERAEMSAVFRTYVDFSEIVPPALFALLLAYFGLPAVFVGMGLGLLAAALVSSGLPRRLGAETQPRRRRHGRAPSSPAPDGATAARTLAGEAAAAAAPVGATTAPAGGREGR